MNNVYTFYKLFYQRVVHFLLSLAIERNKNVKERAKT